MSKTKQIVIGLATLVLLAWFFIGCSNPVVVQKPIPAPAKAVEPIKKAVEPIKVVPPEPIKPVPVKPKPTVTSSRWEYAQINPMDRLRVDKVVYLYTKTVDRYKQVQNMRSDGVPAPVIFCLHMRESDNSFACHLHEGSPLLHRTRDEPKGRLPAPKDPPYTWEVSAEDAIYVCDRLQGDWTDLTNALKKIEYYNGRGYEKRGLVSPYVWAGTTVYTRGKYVADGQFDPMAVDRQLGAACVLKRMLELGITLPFAGN